MTTNTAPEILSPRRSERSGWAGVLILMATSFTLVLAEFLPPSLLTQMAASLDITEGQAGQTVTATAFMGFLVAPVVGMMFPRLDRRTLLTGVALTAAVSNILVAIAPNLVLLLVARLILGAAISGFWAMSLAIVSQLVVPERLGRGLMLVNGGTTVATVGGVPLGVYLGSVFDWRVVFVGVAVVSVLVAILLRTVLPAIAPATATGFRELADTLEVPGLSLGLIGHVLTVLGHFAAFTYIRLAFEQVPSIGAGGIAGLLAAFGIGGLAGNVVIGLLVDKHLNLMRVVVPALISVGIATVALLPGQFWAVGVGATAWGVGFGAWLLVVSTWIGRLAQDRMESVGGLIVTGFQIAITLGAGVGGVVADNAGVQVTLIAAALASLGGGTLFRMARTPSAGSSKA
ncbi:MFS transporter [Rhodococcus sp. NM-2]|jgi:predicted MFS family arabinose efflux permease|uniref:MFS transporter n=1 Tax=Rhodococcus TaxID=1827 RepID=UPI002476BA76|nr:MFS transporter [Rhodococcus opacus]MDH6289704.1 putative MFS family arabinose efflux permease [Rhodococcus opacus]